MTPKPYSYREARELWDLILLDLAILAGDVVPEAAPSGWQDVAGTCAVNLRLLAKRLDAARAGEVSDPPLAFPSPRGR